MASRIGVKVNVLRVAVKAIDEPRPYAIPTDLLTTDWRSVVEDPEVHLITELVGGTGLAKEITLTALKLGKPVITCCRSGARSGSAATILKQNGIDAINGGPWGSVANCMR